MKKQSLLLVFTIVFTICISFSANAAGFKSGDEAIKKLSTYSVADIDGDAKRLKEHQELKIDQMFNDLEDTTKLLEKDSDKADGKSKVKDTSKALLSEDLAYEMERVSLITFIHDPTTFAVDLILPIYQKNKSLFEKAAQRLHPYDRNLLIEILKSKDLADTDNG